MLIILAFLSFFVSADQTTFSRYGEARGVFWGKIYSQTHESLYCQKQFSKRNGLNIEHVFAASWMKATMPECRNKNRKECRRLSARFNLMEADLHNMYPAITTVNSARGSYVFGEVEGYEIKEQCSTEIGDSVVEPTDYAKGRVARSILYMVNEYRVNLDKVTNSPGFENEIYEWHCKFPPSPQEIIRNHRISEFQNTSNPFVLEKHCI